MRVGFERTGSRRKELVTAMGEILGVKPKYLGMPSAAYMAGVFTVTRDGAVECTDDVEIGGLLEKLKEKGIETAGGTDAAAEARETEDGEPQNEGPQEPVREDTEQDGKPQEDAAGEGKAEPAAERNSGNILNIEMPREFFTDGAIENLRKMVDSKAALIRKAVGAGELPIRVTDEKVSFPWFTTADPDEAKAYTEFIAKLCARAKEAKRVTAKEKPLDGDSEKYAFRCFLLRLGFIGDEYKQDRRTLMKNLSGSSAFRRGTAKAAGEEA